MPHAGGGGSGGGFHSSGRGSSNFKSSVPKIDKYVLFNVVGDDIDYEIDRSFGGIGTSFGNAVNDNVPSRNYYGNLYFSLATSLDKVNENLYTKYESSNPKAYKVINKTKYGTINGISSLNDAQEIFYQKTGYNVSFLIVEPGQVSSINYFALVVIIVIGGIIIAAGVLNMFKIKKAVLNFSAELNKGNQAKYFEGEDTYENYMKEYGSKHNFDVFEDEEKE